jgi:sec-independent protein translocase protein TatA
MGEGLFQPMHLLIIFVIALLVFGPKNLPGLGKGLGEAIRGFKDAFKGGDSAPPANPPAAKALPDDKGKTESSEKPKT